MRVSPELQVWMLEQEIALLRSYAKFLEMKIRVYRLAIGLEQAAPKPNKIYKCQDGTSFSVGS